jgi:hypothetical protein
MATLAQLVAFGFIFVFPFYLLDADFFLAAPALFRIGIHTIP